MWERPSGRDRLFDLAKPWEIRSISDTILDMEPVDLRKITIPPEVIARIPRDMAVASQIIPIHFANGTLTVAMANPMETMILRNLAFLLDCKVAGAASTAGDVQWAIDKYYPEGFRRPGRHPENEDSAKPMQELRQSKALPPTEQIDLHTISISPEVIARLPLSMAKVLEVIPIRDESGILTVAMGNPQYTSVLDDLRWMLNCDVVGVASTPEDVRWAIKKYYGRDAE